MRDKALPTRNFSVTSLYKHHQPVNLVTAVPLFPGAAVRVEDHLKLEAPNSRQLCSVLAFKRQSVELLTEGIINHTAFPKCNTSVFVFEIWILLPLV